MKDAIEIQQMRVTRKADSNTNDAIRSAIVLALTEDRVVHLNDSGQEYVFSPLKLIFSAMEGKSAYRV